MFPRPIDEELSQSTLDVSSDYIVPIEAPTHTLIRDLCYDRLEVQVYGEVDAPEECMKPETVWNFLTWAASASNDFLYNCRVAGRDPSISGLTWNYSFNERAYYFSNPYSVTWYGADDKQPLYDDKKQLMHAAVEGSLISPPLNTPEEGVVSRVLLRVARQRHRRLRAARMVLGSSDCMHSPPPAATVSLSPLPA